MIINEAYLGEAINLSDALCDIRLHLRLRALNQGAARGEGIYTVLQLLLLRHELRYLSGNA